MIRGGLPLNGQVEISGSKNGSLPILFGSLLAPGPLLLEGVPTGLRDINTTLEILRQFGAEVEKRDHQVAIEVPTQGPVKAPYDLVKKMRASISSFGPLLARRGEAVVSLPGGCNIGDRPIDLHIQGMEALGAKIRHENGYIIANGPLKGGSVYLSGPMGPTVLGTQNVMMAAAGADGVSVIEGAACEPEIVSTADFLRALGVKIEGDGSPTIRIEGVGQDGFASLGGVTFTIPPDRIETGTYILAGAAAGGRVVVKNCRPKDNLALLSILKNIGVPLEIGEDSVTVTGVDQVTPCDVATLAYPGFPTDLQGPLMALLCKTDGVSLITEKIFPDRFMHLSELRRFGAKVRKEGSTGIIEGGAPLHGAEVMASDLRASACLVIAGLMASGTTQVRRIYHLQRGYESMEVKLRGLGADVERVEDRQIESETVQG